MQKYIHFVNKMTRSNITQQCKDQYSEFLLNCLEVWKLFISGKLKSTELLWQLSHFTQDAKKVNEEVDQVVAEHKEEHKRILGDLWQGAKDLFGKGVEAVKGVFSGVSRPTLVCISYYFRRLLAACFYNVFYI